MSVVYATPSGPWRPNGRVAPHAPSRGAPPLTCPGQRAEGGPPTHRKDQHKLLGDGEGDGDAQMDGGRAGASSFSPRATFLPSQYGHYCVFAFCGCIVM